MKKIAQSLNNFFAAHNNKTLDQFSQTLKQFNDRITELHLAFRQELETPETLFSPYEIIISTTKFDDFIKAEDSFVAVFNIWNRKQDILIIATITFSGKVNFSIHQVNSWAEIDFAVTYTDRTDLSDQVMKLSVRFKDRIMEGFMGLKVIGTIDFLDIDSPETIKKSLESLKLGLNRVSVGN